MRRMVTVDYGFVDSVLKEHGYDKTNAIAILQDIQGEYSFLPKEALIYIAEKLGVSEANLYGVATFYENFSLNEKGKYVIKCSTALPATSASRTMCRRLCIRRPG